MIHVEVYSPILGKSYEFQVNEEVRIDILIEELASVISTGEQIKWSGGTDRLILCDVTRGCMLPVEQTLNQCRVKAGTRLLLV